MKDKFRIGLISGTIGTAWIQIMNLLSLPLHFKHNYWDYASFIAFRHMPHTLGELIVSISIQVFFSIQLGLIYSLLENYIKTRYDLIKGSVYGGSIWFVIQGVISIFNVKLLSEHGWFEVIWEFGIAIIFGVINSWVIERYKKAND